MAEPAVPFRIALINMPFAYLGMPSIALTQLAAALDRRFGPAVQIDILYLHLDFAAYFNDTDLYNHTLSGTALMTGVGEWFFRQLAFPEAPDNAEAYYHRFYHNDNEETRALRNALEEKRAGAGDFLDACFDRYDLGGYQLVGFTTLFSQTVPSMAMARRIKDRSPHVLTAIGGSACDEVMGIEIAEHIEAFDAVFSGPGLESFPNYVDALLQQKPEAIRHIQGLFTRANRPLPLQAGAGRMPLGDDSDINEVLPLDYTGFLDKLEEVFPDGRVEPVLLFETSRGCWWAEKSVCTFCGLNGLQMKHRPMSPENARAYIEALYAYVPRCRIFMCVDTILPHRYPQEPPRSRRFHPSAPCRPTSDG